jgi:hypothetical protein
VDRAEPWPDAKIEKKTKRYPSDLTDEEWERIAPLMPKPGRRGGRGRSNPGGDQRATSLRRHLAAQWECRCEDNYQERG